MAWKIEFKPQAEDSFQKLDGSVRKRILKFLDERIRPAENPRAIGEALRGSRLGEFWKYRVGDYRLICQIEDKLVTVTVIKIGHRGEVYRPQ